MAQFQQFKVGSCCQYRGGARRDAEIIGRPWDRINRNKEVEIKKCKIVDLGTNNKNSHKLQKMEKEEKED